MASFRQNGRRARLGRKLSAETIPDTTRAFATRVKRKSSGEFGPGVPFLRNEAKSYGAGGDLCPAPDQAIGVWCSRSRTGTPPMLIWSITTDRGKHDDDAQSRTPR